MKTRHIGLSRANKRALLREKLRNNDKYRQKTKEIEMFALQPVVSDEEN